MIFVITKKRSKLANPKKVLSKNANQAKKMIKKQKENFFDNDDDWCSIKMKNWIEIKRAESLSGHFFYCSHFRTKMNKKNGNENEDSKY